MGRKISHIFTKFLQEVLHVGFKAVKVLSPNGSVLRQNQYWIITFKYPYVSLLPLFVFPLLYLDRDVFGF